MKKPPILNPWVAPYTSSLWKEQQEKRNKIRQEASKKFATAYGVIESIDQPQMQTQSRDELRKTQEDDTKAQIQTMAERSIGTWLGGHLQSGGIRVDDNAILEVERLAMSGIPVLSNLAQGFLDYQIGQRLVEIGEKCAKQQSTKESKHTTLRLIEGGKGKGESK